MSVRMRHTKGHSGNRRSHHALDGVRVVKDAESGKLRLPHRLDESTGMYRGKAIFQPKVKKAAVAQAPVKPAKNEAEKHAAHEHEHAHESEGSKGVLGKVAGATRPRTRSGTEGS